VFGRVRRAVATLPIEERVRSCAVLHVYSPQAISGVLAASAGAAGFASGATIARTPDGGSVSALGELVTGAMDWGRREQKRYLPLPHRVLVVATSDAVIIYEWTVGNGVGRQVARWETGTFSATKLRYSGQIGARVVVGSGKVAIMTGRKGPLHPSTRATVEAVIAAGQISNA
jgi:hypothetical protein